MSYELRDLQGSLFPNERATGRQPELTGKVMVGGQLYRIAAWRRTTPTNAGYYSLALTPMTNAQPQPATPAKPAPGPATQPAAAELPFDDSDIPF